ncbi:hypothetical protein [Rhodococcus sp. X156]|uniref:hypothetical protein n=1 Tax=Rhodococcus sp. X156 TaxID=2499145 RepID=UPI0019D0AFB3|nr:hypothetical protein [Rhodococcus sp. X156]
MIDNPDTVLWQAAFGGCPERAVLPEPSSQHGRWWRAVALGGQGRYAAAEAELRLVTAGAGTDSLASLASSTRASHLRQLGGHTAAKPWDGRALLLAGSAPEAAAARCDALLGLAADALGSAQVRVSQRLLARCRDELDVAEELGAELAAAEAGAGWRARLRWHWVSAETALCADDIAGAREHGELADALAHRCPSVRHQVKSRLVHAAARGTDGGAPLAAEVLAQAHHHGLLPLEWAAGMLLRALQPTGSVRAEALGVDLAAAEQRLARRGGPLR